MVACYRITYEPSAVVEDFFDCDGDWYQYSNEMVFPLLPRMVWCNRCRRISQGEWIPSRRGLLLEIIRSRDPEISTDELCRAVESEKIVNSYLRRPTVSESFHDQWDRMRLDWIGRRQSRPKCIVCGATEIVFTDDAGVITISEEQKAKLTIVGFGSGGRCDWLYSLEGVRLRPLTSKELKSLA
jgi:hypothetical protein